MHKLNESFSKLQAEVSVSKQVNTLLSSMLVSIESHCWFNAQHSRRECLDIVDIFKEVEADALEEKVVAIFEKLGCNIPTERIEARCRISKKNPEVIVKFLRRKNYHQVWDVKRDLQKIKMEDIDLPGQNKAIWGKSKKLRSIGKIHSFLFRVIQLRLRSAKIVPRCL